MSQSASPVVAAGLGSATEHALVSLLALNGLRVSEATGADRHATYIVAAFLAGAAR